MADYEVGFCSECCDEIISRKLMIFWKCTCMSVVTDKKWLAFQPDDNEANKYIKLLEEKNFIISTDHEDKVLIKPNGILEKEDGSFLVCLCPTEHFEAVQE